jgi:holo-[acyl-carrier protein] synthase
MIIGIGTDLVDIGRIEQVGADRLARRVLTEDERAHLPQEPVRRLEFVAGRFAAKEAVAKAAGTGIGGTVRFRDIRIQPDERGKPVAELNEAARRKLGWEEKVLIHLSISHTPHQALAFAVAERIDK